MSRARGTVAALAIHHPSDSPQVIEAKRELRSIKLQEYVAKAVAELPPLSEDQLKEVARLLLPSMVATEQAPSPKHPKGSGRDAA